MQVIITIITAFMVVFFEKREEEDTQRTFPTKDFS